MQPGLDSTNLKGRQSAMNGSPLSGPFFVPRSLS